MIQLHGLPGIVEQIARLIVRAVPVGVTSKLVAGEPDLRTAERIRFQGSEGASVLVVAAPAGVLEAPGIYLVGDVTAHVGEVVPAVASGIASFHF